LNQEKSVQTFPKMPSQPQLFYEAGRKLNQAHEVFLDLVRGGMTREELARNIERQPALWRRYSTWLRVLPAGSSKAA
jgi:hypothetical protein